MNNLDRSQIYQCKIDIQNQNESHTQILKMIPYDSRVLDVGCACGDLGYYLKKNMACRVWGIEYNTKSLEIALTSKSYENIVLADLNTFEPLNEYKNSCHNFDYIVFGDVLEHLVDIEKIIEKFKKVLTPNGSIIISLPNVSHGSIKAQILSNKFDYMNYGVLDRTHLRFFTWVSIVELLGRLKLQLKEATRTIFDLPGLHPYRIQELIPSNVFEFIAADNHSYVYQYILKVQPSEKCSQELNAQNTDMITTFTTNELELISDFQKNLNLRHDKHYNSPITIQPFSLSHGLKSFLKKKIPHSTWNGLRTYRNRLLRGYNETTLFLRKLMTGDRRKP